VKESTPDDPKADFHDIGKIVDWTAVGLRETSEPDPHEFEKCLKHPDQWDLRLDSNACWRCISRKNTELLEKHYKDSNAWLFVSFADHLAAGFGRTVPEHQVNADPEYHYYCLWTNKCRRTTFITTKSDLKDLIQFLNKDPSWDETKEKYKSHLLSRPEIRRGGMNVTTLLAHSEVAGKLARVIAKMDWSAVKAGAEWRDINPLAGGMRLWAARIEAAFKQRPYRARDLGVFAAVAQRIEETRKEFPDHVLAVVENQMIVVYENEKLIEMFREKLRPFVMEGNWQLGSLQSNQSPLETLAQSDRRLCESEPAERIDLPICENCQAAHADKVWPQRRMPEEPQEDLCEDCYEIREQALSLTKLQNWQTGSVVWVRTHLDLNQLHSSLTYLHKEYLESKLKTPNEGLGNNLYVPIPTVVDFLTDYSCFLDSVNKMLIDLLTVDCVQQVAATNNAPWLWCCHLHDDRTKVNFILRRICNEMKNSFPKLIGDIECPIRFGLSVSNAKHPFFDHWRYLENPSDELIINLVASGTASLKIKDAEKVLNAISSMKAHAVHLLASVANRSESLAKLVMKNKDTCDTELGTLLNEGQLSFETAKVLVNLSDKRSKDG